MRSHILHNPLWYVMAMAGLTALTIYVPGLWWLVGVVALGWGGLVIGQMFAGELGDTAPGVSPSTQTYLDQAQRYKKELEPLLRASNNRSSRQERQRLAGQLDRWVAAIETLSQRITDLQRDRLIRHEMLVVPQAIQALETRLASETDPAVRMQLAQTLANRKGQVESLARLNNTLERAKLQIENTVSLFGTIYARLLTDHATHQVVDHSRLSANLDEAVARLNDQLAALREVKDPACDGCTNELLESFSPPPDATR